VSADTPPDNSNAFALVAIAIAAISTMGRRRMKGKSIFLLIMILAAVLSGWYYLFLLLESLLG
jgi:hypothetical protein